MPETFFHMNVITPVIPKCAFSKLPYGFGRANPHGCRSQVQYMSTSRAHAVALPAGSDQYGPSSSWRRDALHLKYNKMLRGGIHVAISLMAVSEVLLGTPGSRWVGFSSQRNRELKLNYFGRLLENNKSYLSPGGTRER